MECVYEKGEVRIFRISDRVYLRQLDFRRTNQCNSVFLIGDDGIGVVDVSQEESPAQLREEAREVFGGEIRAVFLTHRHGDHMNGLPGMLDTPKTVFLADNLYRRLDPALQRSGSTFITVRDRLQLNFGGLELELIRPQGVMHCDDEMFIRVPEAHAVCTGDSAVDFREFYCLTGDLDNWILCLETMFGPEDRLFLPGHGMPVGPEGLREMADNIRLMQRAGERMRAWYTPEAFAELGRSGIRAAAERFMWEDSEDARALRRAARDYAEEHLELILRYLLYRV